MMHDPLQNKRRPAYRSKRRRLPILIVSVIVIVVVGLAYTLLFSPLFRVQNVVVEYTDIAEVSSTDIVVLPPHVLDDETKTALKNDLEEFLRHPSRVFSLFGKRFIFAWPAGSVSQDFLKAKTPYASDLRIEKNYWSREIRIVLTLREPIGIWCSVFSNPSRIASNESQILENASSSYSSFNSSSFDENSRETRCRWFDKQGIAGEEAPASAGNLVINVMDFSGRNLDADPAVLDSKQFYDLLGIIKALSAADIPIRSFAIKNPELAEIESAPASFLPRIQFSLRNDTGFLLPALRELKKIGLEKINGADLRVEGRVYYTLR